MSFLFCFVPKVKELSEKFVMVNLGDNDEPKDEQFKPDGSYIPRIFFVHPNGKVMQNIINKDGNPKYKYFYVDTEALVDSMDEVLSISESWVKDEL